MSENQKTYSFVELIRYLIDFFFGRRKRKAEERKSRFEKTQKKVDGKFEDIDEKKEKAKNEDIEKRLNNMFD